MGNLYNLTNRLVALVLLVKKHIWPWCHRSTLNGSTVNCGGIHDQPYNLQRLKAAFHSFLNLKTPYCLQAILKYGHPLSIILPSGNGWVLMLLVGKTDPWCGYKLVNADYAKKLRYLLEKDPQLEEYGSEFNVKIYNWTLF